MKTSEMDYIPLPEIYTRRQLNALYREIPLKDTVSRILRKYFKTMKNLYGVITLEKAFEIISSQRPKLVTEKEFLAFAEIARHEPENYFIFGEDEIYADAEAESPFKREIIDSELFYEDIDQYERLKRLQKGKPFYIPDKNSFLLYADLLYCEEIPEVTELKTFLKNGLCLTEVQVWHIFDQILFNSRYLNDEFENLMKQLEECGLVFDKDTDLQRFIDLYQRFHNKTRMQCNRGHTPEELFQMQSSENWSKKSISFGPNIRKSIADGTMDIEELRRNILTMDMPSEELRIKFLEEIYKVETEIKENTKTKKVGRNDLCPCGSGKKYKKCCGR